MIIVDAGADDLAVYRKAELSTEGTVTIGPANAEPFEHVFTGIERLQVVDETGTPLNAGTGNDARLVTFKFDPHELNDDRFTSQCRIQSLFLLLSMAFGDPWPFSLTVMPLS